MDLIINFNKPKDITSHQATTKVKKIVKAKKAGHAGTLDPSATGVLLVCINKATRIASYLSSLDKEYRAVMKLGEVTDTQDADGTVIRKSDDMDIDETLIETVLQSFQGVISQVPPMYSALKYMGRPLYQYAKKGIHIPLEPRKITIHSIEVLHIRIPFVGFRVVCSKGTYIRALCNDAGVKLGVGAHLFELERTAIGPFKISDSISFDGVSSMNMSQPGAGQFRHPLPGIHTMDNALLWMPELKIDGSLVRVVKNGHSIDIGTCADFSDSLKTASGIRIKSPDGELLAIGSFSSEKSAVIMDVVFST